MLNTFSKNKAIDILKNQPGVNISHIYFDKDEYLYGGDGVVRDENDYLFEDWDEDDTIHAGMRSRTGESWNTGWYYY